MERLSSHEMIKYALDYLDKLQTDKEKLKQEITEEVSKPGSLLSSLKHPVYLDLKEKLQSISSQGKQDRQLISKATLELLELYWTR